MSADVAAAVTHEECQRLSCAAAATIQTHVAVVHGLLGGAEERAHLRKSTPCCT